MPEWLTPVLDLPEKAMAFARCLFAVLLVLRASVALAQEVTSGPGKGEAVPALRVFDATGANKDKDIDYAAERKDKPTVYVFIQADKWSRPAHRFLSELDKKLQKDVADAYLVAVWLTDKPDETKQYLPRIGTYYTNAALTCFTGEKVGPQGWNVNGDADVTAVVASKQKVAATFGYRSLNETDVPGVVDAMKKAVDKK
jgi:hypothetical protein